MHILYYNLVFSLSLSLSPFLPPSLSLSLPSFLPPSLSFSLQVVDHITLLVEDWFTGVRPRFLVVPCPHCSHAVPGPAPGSERIPFLRSFSINPQLRPLNDIVDSSVCDNVDLLSLSLSLTLFLFVVLSIFCSYTSSYYFYHCLSSPSSSAA